MNIPGLTAAASLYIGRGSYCGNINISKVGAAMVIPQQDLGCTVLCSEVGGMQRQVRRLATRIQQCRLLAQLPQALDRLPSNDVCSDSSPEAMLHQTAVLWNRKP